MTENRVNEHTPVQVGGWVRAVALTYGEGRTTDAQGGRISGGRGHMVARGLVAGHTILVAGHTILVAGHTILDKG